MIFNNTFPSLLVILNGTLKRVESFSHADTWGSAEPLSFPLKVKYNLIIPILNTVFNDFFSLFYTGLKAMVSQGVKNPLIDLTALDDYTLDEVSSCQKNQKKPNTHLSFI